MYICVLLSDRGQPDEIFQQATGKKISDNKTINYLKKIMFRSALTYVYLRFLCPYYTRVSINAKEIKIDFS